MTRLHDLRLRILFRKKILKELAVPVLVEIIGSQLHVNKISFLHRRDFILHDGYHVVQIGINCLVGRFVCAGDGLPFLQLQRADFNSMLCPVGVVILEVR